jgi:hypothetical protein
MSLNTTPRTWAAGEVVTAAEMNTEVRDAITGIQAAWTAYTPTLTATTTSPTLGTGSSATGAYLQIGKLFFVRGVIVFGTSGVVAGSGNYRVSMPTSLSTGYNAWRVAYGQAILEDSSASSRVVRFLMAPSSGASVAALIDVAGAQVTDAVPWVWAASDAISWSATFQAA